MNDAQRATMHSFREKLVDDTSYEALKIFLLAHGAVEHEFCETIEEENHALRNRTLGLIEYLTKIGNGWTYLHDFLHENRQSRLSKQLLVTEAMTVKHSDAKGAEAVRHSLTNLGEGLHYDPTKLIGSGACGSVYEGRLHIQNVAHVVAIKIFEGIANDEIEDAARKLHHFSHDNIVKMFDVRRVFEPPQIALVLEKGDASLAQALREGNIPFAAKLSIGKDIARGLQYLHGLKVVHRDLKPDNILLFNVSAGGCVAKLVDFDFSHQLRTSMTITDRWRGTPRYMAPELLSGQGTRQPAEYGVSVDVYALGMTLYELFTGQSVFCGLGIDNDFALMYQIGMADRRPSFAASFPYPGIRVLIERCWIKEPSARPAASAVCDSICASEAEMVTGRAAGPQAVPGCAQRV